MEIVSFTLGPAATNAYLVGDPPTATAVVVDPAWDGALIQSEARRRDWRITQIWLTHAHFDHFGGAGGVSDASPNPIPVALHPADQPLWRLRGGAAAFGFADFDPGPEPTLDLEHGGSLSLGDTRFEVRHTPGHTPGHVIFHDPIGGVVFCGDLIFSGSVGRTDLPGGDTEQLLASIREEILKLPDSTRLFPGHGPATTVGEERHTNPFLADLPGGASAALGL
jgi:glyoxylase-like metal-dependent hydrolase (beta-lactamase superfamily II)